MRQLLSFIDEAHVNGAGYTVQFGVCAQERKRSSEWRKERERNNKCRKEGKTEWTKGRTVNMSLVTL